MLKAQELREQLRKEIIGQDRAIDAVVRAVMVAELGICDPRRPLGTFLFLGPTGTGKSQIGRSLAKVLHGDENEVVAVNCTEFKNPHDVAKLVGAPPGYVGHEQPPFLTQEKLDRKLTIVIFEELEKADRAFYDLLLQILERGELKTGRAVDLTFRNCFIMMTSNVCAKEVDDITKNAVIGFSPPIQKFEELDQDSADAKIQTVCIGAVEDFFSPEFINRIDEIIFFHALGVEHMKQIVDIQVRGRLKRLEERKIHVELSEEAKSHIVREGYDPAYGARPLKRAIQKLVLDPLALRVLEGEFREGDRVTVDVGDNGLMFVKGQAVTA